LKLIPIINNFYMLILSDNFPYTAVPIEKVNIYAVFTQFVIPGVVLK
ncbi:hypothetical protein T815_02766, partial [Staphylococcus aureus AGEN6010]